MPQPLTEILDRIRVCARVRGSECLVGEYEKYGGNGRAHGGIVRVERQRGANLEINKLETISDGDAFSGLQPADYHGWAG